MMHTFNKYVHLWDIEPMFILKNDWRAFPCCLHLNRLTALPIKKKNLNFALLFQSVWKVAFTQKILVPKRKERWPATSSSVNTR